MKVPFLYIDNYRLTLVVADLSWVDFDLGVSASCPVARPILPNTHLPKQNQADNGITQIIVNPTEVRNHQSHSEQCTELRYKVGPRLHELPERGPGGEITEGLV